MSVKLYTIEELKSVAGLYPDKALSKMNGNMEVYSALLDKFLNQAPRTIPRLKQFLKEKKIADYAEELKNLRIDLADIFALDLLARANILYETAANGDTDRCAQQLEPFVQSLQSFSFEVKQCRTQESLTNEGDAVSKAAELDIGARVVNNKYSTVNKKKFLDLYTRIDNGLIDKAQNLTNVLKAMGYDSEISRYLLEISTALGLNKTKVALEAGANLLKLLGCKVPAAKPEKFTLLLVDSSKLREKLEKALGSDAVVQVAVSTATAQEYASKNPSFILVNSHLDGMDGFFVAGHLRTEYPDIPLGFLFEKATPEDIINARSLGAVESFLLPLDDALFLEKMKKYMK